MKSGTGPFTISMLKSAVLELEEKTAMPLLALLNELEALNLFDKIDSHNIFDLCKQGQLTIIDLNKIYSERKKQVIVYYLSKNFFNLRRNNLIPP
ncbi:MAG: hypothetical protein D4R68_04175, partial [Ignavibacteriales bacterium]